MRLRILFATAACLASCAAQAEVPTNGVATLNAAMRTVGAQFQADVPKGAPPRWSVPADRAALERVWDATAILGTAPYTGKDVPAMLDIMQAENNVLKAYTFFGMKTPDAGQTAKNLVVYQDETVRASAFLVRTIGGLLEAIGDFAVNLPKEQMTDVRRKGIDGARSGLRQTITDFNAQLRLPEVKPENKAILVEALATNAAVIAVYSPIADRTSYVETAKTTLATLPVPDQARMRTFIDAMATKDCEGLCALAGK